MSPNRPAAAGASGSAFEASDAEADASHRPSSPSPSKTPPPDPNPQTTTPPAPAPAAEDTAAAGSDSGAAYDSDADHRPAHPKPAASPSRRTARRSPKPRPRSPTPEANSDSNGSAAPAASEADPTAGDGADSEYGNASPLPPPRPEAAAIKPLSSRPMDPPRRSVPSFSEPRPKRPGSATAPAVMEQLKRPSRLWSPGDEVVILRGLTAYRAKRGVLPSSMHDISKFYGHISNELSVKVTTTQLSDKVRRLRQKYHQLATRAKNGRDPDFPIPQDHSIYDLGKKVWGPNAVAGGGSSIVEYEDSGSGDSDEERLSGHESDGDMESGRDDRDRKKKRLKPITTANGGGSRLGAIATSGCSRGKVEFEKAKDAYPYLWETVEDLSRQHPNGLAFKKGFETIEGPKARGMEEKLRKFRVTEVRHQLRRMELMKETVKMVLDALGG